MEEILDHIDIEITASTEAVTQNIEKTIAALTKLGEVASGGTLTGLINQLKELQSLSFSELCNQLDSVSQKCAALTNLEKTVQGIKNQEPVTIGTVDASKIAEMPVTEDQPIIGTVTWESVNVEGVKEDAEQLSEEVIETGESFNVATKKAVSSSGDMENTVERLTRMIELQKEEVGRLAETWNALIGSDKSTDTQIAHAEMQMLRAQGQVENLEKQLSSATATQNVELLGDKGVEDFQSQCKLIIESFEYLRERLQDTSKQIENLLGEKYGEFANNSKYQSSDQFFGGIDKKVQTITNSLTILKGKFDELSTNTKTPSTEKWLKLENQLLSLYKQLSSVSDKAESTANTLRNLGTKTIGETSGETGMPAISKQVQADSDSILQTFSEVNEKIQATKEELQNLLTEKQGDFGNNSKYVSSSQFVDGLDDKVQKLTNSLTILTAEFDELKNRADAPSDEEWLAYENRLLSLRQQFTNVSDKAESTANTLRNLGTATSPSLETLNGKVKEVKNSVEELGIATDTSANKSKSWAAKFMTSVKRITLYRLIRGMIKQATSAFKEGIENYARYSDEVNETMSELKSIYQQLSNTLGVTLAQTLTLLLPAIQTLSNAFIDLLNEVNRFLAIIQGKDTYSKAIKQNLDYADSLDDVQNSLLGIDEINKLSDNDTEDYSSMFEEVEVGIELSEAAQDDWAVALDEYLESIGLYDAIDNFFDGIWDSICNFFADRWQVVCDIFAEDWGHVKDFWVGVWEAFIAWCNDVWDGIENIGYAIGDFFVSIKDWFVDTWNSICDFFEGVWDTISSFFVGLWNDIVDVWGSICDFFKGVWDSIVGFFVTAWDNIVGVWNNVGDFFVGIWDTISGFFAGLDWGSIGKNIIDGIVNGLTSAVKSVGSAITDTCSSIWSGIKSFFGINSPSTLMRDTVGNYLAEGIGVGFEDEIADVVDNMQHELDRSMNASFYTEMDAPVLDYNGNYSTTGDTDIYSEVWSGVRDAMSEFDSGDITIQFVSDGQVKSEQIITAAERRNRRDGKKVIAVEV